MHNGEVKSHKRNFKGWGGLVAAGGVLCFIDPQFQIQITALLTENLSGCHVATRVAGLPFPPERGVSWHFWHYRGMWTPQSLKQLGGVCLETTLNELPMWHLWFFGWMGRWFSFFRAQSYMLFRTIKFNKGTGCWGWLRSLRTAPFSFSLKAA